MNPSGGFSPDFAKFRILVPDMKIKSCDRSGSKKAIFSFSTVVSCYPKRNDFQILRPGAIDSTLEPCVPSYRFPSGVLDLSGCGKPAGSRPTMKKICPSHHSSFGVPLHLCRPGIKHRAWKNSEDGVFVQYTLLENTLVLVYPN